MNSFLEVLERRQYIINKIDDFNKALNFISDIPKNELEKTEEYEKERLTNEKAAFISNDVMLSRCWIDRLSKGLLRKRTAIYNEYR